LHDLPRPFDVAQPTVTSGGGERQIHGARRLPQNRVKPYDWLPPGEAKPTIDDPAA
jgi:hypothetical protein